MNRQHKLSGYTDEEGRFTRLPGRRQKKKLDLMLEELAEKFVTDRNYTEMEVNEILNAFHTFGDPATFRRLLFGCGFLDRTKDGKKYWKIEKSLIQEES